MLSKFIQLQFTQFISIVISLESFLSPQTSTFLKNERHFRYRQSPHTNTNKHSHTTRRLKIFVRKLLEKDIATVPFGCIKPLSAETCHGSWQQLFVSAVPSFSPRLSISFSCFSEVEGKMSKNAPEYRRCI